MSALPDNCLELPTGAGVMALPRARLLTCHDQQDPQRAVIEQFIHRRFADAYAADVRSFMPTLVALRGQDARILAAAGFRAAAQSALFVEQYLDHPVEQCIAAATGETVQRAQIVEVGNLAAHHAGSTRLFINTLGELLRQKNFRWLTCNAIPAVQNAFRQVGVPFLMLQTADKNRLGAAAEQWGRYYDQNSCVIAARIPEQPVASVYGHAL